MFCRRLQPPKWGHLSSKDLLRPDAKGLGHAEPARASADDDGSNKQIAEVLPLHHNVTWEVWINDMGDGRAHGKAEDSNQKRVLYDHPGDRLVRRPHELQHRQRVRLFEHRSIN